jgi:type IV pilus assembly protein PilE
VTHDASRGFTLIELMIAVVIIGILSAIAIPSYSDYMTKSRRSDAWAALGAAVLEQEKFRANNATYDGSYAVASPDGYYSITTTLANSTSYTLSADPTGAQLGDTDCDPITVNESGVYDPASCARR